MNPVDFRNATWEGIQNRISGQREAVLRALRLCGPATTRALADFMRLEPLQVRPRITELFQLGFVVEVTDDETPAREGTYRALTDEEAFEQFRARKFPQSFQLDFKNL